MCHDSVCLIGGDRRSPTTLAITPLQLLMALSTASSEILLLPLPFEQDICLPTSTQCTDSNEIMEFDFSIEETNYNGKKSELVCCKKEY